MPSEATPAPKDAPKKFRPRKKPISKDTPSSQEKPPSEPTPFTETMIEAHKPKVDIKTAKKTEPRNEPLDIPEVLVLGLSGLNLRPGKLHYGIDASGYADIIKAT